MSILIKGMKMPEHGCNHCFLRKGNYCTRIKPGDYVYVVKFSLEETRHPNCPLVEIKTPHGRLIDADELLECYTDIDGAYDPEFWDQLQTSIGVIRQNIDDMPAIIEAEKGNENN